MARHPYESRNIERKPGRISKDVAKWRREWRQGARYVLFICLRDEDESLAGRISLNNVVRGAWQNASLGYFIAQSEQHKGLMTEAVRAVTRFAFDVVGLHRLDAAVMPRNPGSLRVLEKTGFRREGSVLRYLKIAGTWEDHVLFARTVEDVD